ncbi:MAG TPA: AmmeMemoRadiSam system protein B [Ilumatobacteraceae bacterium]|nr:AmmeMemoRadiSam system protein B [Ilumatobacteraceae bacterium]
MSGTVLRVRPAAVAGTFYPNAPTSLRQALQHSFDAAAPLPSGEARVPKALVVPHAGYQYSGPIAASAYARLGEARHAVRRVVLAGPSHRVYLRGLGLSSADAFDTPLGLVRVDTELRDEVVGLPGVHINDAAHAYEHSLEVQLPFLQTVLDNFTFLPLSVGDATTDEVAAVLEACWGGPETLVVVSTDLSHYLPYAEARGVDACTAAAIVGSLSRRISDTAACGARALRGLLRVATERNLTVEQLDLRNSGDTAGGHDKVVGYGAFAVA